jgi:hypothetical protein
MTQECRKHGQLLLDIFTSSVPADQRLDREMVPVIPLTALPA